jgi:hypothetical protein
VPGQEHVEPATGGGLSRRGGGASLRRFVASAALLAGILLVAGDAWVARAADLVNKTLTYKGDAARALAGLLELPSDKGTVVKFELSQMDEDRVLSHGDAAPGDHHHGEGDPAHVTGHILPEWQAASTLRETVTWDPAAGTLVLEGFVSDTSTAIPRMGGFAYSFHSPLFTESEIDKLPGWQPLLPKIAAKPATPIPGGALLRTMEIPLDGKEGASLSLTRMQTWDSKSNATMKSYLTVAFGATVQPGASKPGDEGSRGGSGGSSRACGCRVGSAGDAGAVWAAACGAAMLGVWRRRRGRGTTKG